MPTEVLFIADERQLAVNLDPRYTYAPSPVPKGGTVYWLTMTPPSDEDPRDRVRV
jgi:hypothetical protein